MTPVRYHVVLPGPAETPTGGFVYDRQMIAALRGRGLLASSIVLPGDFPSPSAATIDAARRAIAAVPDGDGLVVDGLALTPLRALFAEAAARLRLVALVHHPLCDETGVSPADGARLFAEERRALASACGVVVTSRHTAARLADFDVPEERVRVVLPGVHPPQGGARRGGGSGPPVLLCVASLTRRKGQDVLLRALSRLRRHPWRLDLVGPARDAAFAGRVRRLARGLRLAPRVRITGAVGPRALGRVYRRADAFVLPSHHEGFGIVLAEAAAYGLPIVASRAGATPEAVAGARHRLVPPGDAVALAAALRPTLTRPAERRRSPGRSHVRAWADAGREFVAAVTALSRT